LEAVQSIRIDALADVFAQKRRSILLRYDDEITRKLAMLDLQLVAA
jgi:hypothetical protein